MNNNPFIGGKCHKMKANEVKIKYLRKDRNGEKTAEFWVNREVGQIIEDSAFKGSIDEVLEIIVVSKTSEQLSETEHRILEAVRNNKPMNIKELKEKLYGWGTPAPDFLHDLNYLMVYRHLLNITGSYNKSIIVEVHKEGET